MIEIYKIKVIRKDSNTQFKKKVYESKKKFLRYGKDIFHRHHNVVRYKSLELYCEIYQMDSVGNWIKIDIPVDFLGEHSE